MSAVVAYLPVHVADPVERLAAVRAELSDLKASKEAILGEELVTLGRYTPFPLMSRGIRLAFALPQREIVTVTTNVPGPREPLYGLGRTRGDHPLRADRDDGPHRDRDLHLLRCRHFRGHR